MEETIKIGCPCCGSVLTVRNMPGIENKFVTCPTCKTKAYVSKFRRIVQSDECTKVPGQDNTETVNKNENMVIGQLVNLDLGIRARLNVGRNIVGRKTSSSTATIPLPCPTNRMSRSHINIDVQRVNGKGFVHYISLCKEKVNKTYIGDELLEYGDKIVLRHGDIIRLPDLNLRFELPDEEATTF